MTTVTFTDMFCGAGGSTTGAKDAGFETKYALNHWQLAVDTYGTNHPEAQTDCVEVRATHPGRYQRTSVLIASPECTNHSLAKGVRRRTTQIDMFEGPIDPSAERSRATMWDVPTFAEHHRYDVVIIENVVDARHWLPYEAWLHAMTLLGYEHQELYINSMHCRPTPQSRDRLYVVFWKKTMKTPDLEFTATAWCPKCERNVEARQAWKKRKRWGRYGSRMQYVYGCPTCHTQVEPYYYAAANAVDWDLPVQRIGDREKPLVQKTRDRIEAGLRRYGIIPQAVTNTSPGWTHPLTEPAPTMVASASLHALLLPTTHADPRANQVTDAWPTQTTRQELALVVHQRDNSVARGITEPLSTMTAGGVQHELVIPYYGTGIASSTSEALPTVTTTNRFGLLDPKPFILGYYTRTSGEKVAISDILDAWPTLAAQPRHALIYPDINAIIDDCGFRMFEPHEIQAAMALPEWYALLGTKRDKIRLAGNAVTPPVMAWICSRVKGIL